MSYLLNTSCNGCPKRGFCIDEIEIKRAICDIHSHSWLMDGKVGQRGHMGSGSITLNCSNKAYWEQEAAKAAAGETAKP